MGTVPIPPLRPRPRTQYGGQSNEALLRLMSFIEGEIASREAPTPEATQLDSRVCRVRRGVLREWFAPEGLIGYVINGEIETTETLFALPDGMCLSYEEIPGDTKDEQQ